ncbi:expression site-associated gene (ESAG) protein, putative; expression site-associated gene 1 (ESAG1) protein, putative [Trypanosoma brucei brucei TREU927]|uniref:Expression site-associated gene (ESAG) protein, putative expression site-associated gene 1 (ESAG1) protein, putative n=1 Tax=Trypanosoma brucei brucei (strain 927/4 GUTat10.1) TaxID=185431 RepID=Q4GY61_TRYB2|nr:expression site-associated gene (ESAG) protein; expression site-associated gene 1 (ESAG1) [Trypanosoma brucei brucei TREU927]CAJ16726.1 expression site-associated gene (ESAG) protein, putative; expression site-associated gene 1 (ESAG1) protein, putative [Trypanosoma brucei brucei TREU927]
MKVAVFQWLIWAFLMACACGKDDYTLVTDHEGDAPLNESVCYLSCLSDALNNLYSDSEKRLFVNEEVYANASRILDDMEGKSGESTKYLSVISSVISKQNDKLEKLISYGNEMGDLVANVGGLFSEVNESVRAVREVLPSALIRANKYYTAIAEIVRTVWDDVNRPLKQDEAKCGNQNFGSVGEPKNECVYRTCPLGDGVSEDTLQHYKKGGIEINVQTGSVSECFNRPRDNLYRNGAEKHSSDVLKWLEGETTRLQLTVEVQKIFGPLIVPFAAGQSPSALRAMMSNITFLYSHFKEVHSNFTLMLHDTNITDNLNSTHSTI